MGNVQSSNCLRYEKIPDSSDLQTQPLLHDENQFELEQAVQAYLEKSSALEKEIGALKSDFSRLETKLQTKSTEGNKQEAITNLEKRFDKWKTSLDGFIVGREAEKRINSAELSRQGRAIMKMEEKNMNQEMKIAELENIVNVITSFMVDMAGLISELDDESSKEEEVDPQNEVMNHIPSNPLEKSRQGRATVNIEEKNNNLEKKIAELENEVNGMKSSMVDMASLISEFNAKSSKEEEEVHPQNEVTNNISSSPEEAPAELKEARITDITIKLSEDEFQVCFMIMIFLVAFLIGLNL